ncbi:MAG: hypothetical protein PHE04_00905 [Bacteroidales bacterium]|nr:hypothetical protein [Bacteroidales bacterium]MDD3431345.1 hypothetical protein [Bacteroidales bacterium]MDD4361782.1 hypothetical protein [Bacteroidales bacterium]MDD4430088.1 hypothetical protein [Bacteroidales bacterium]
MVYKFRLLSDESDLFCREILIDSEAYFLDLHNSILKSVDYEKNMITSFFMCNEKWEKELEVTLIEMDSSPEVDSWVMSSTRLSEMLDEEGQRLIFVFDNLTERAFYLELIEILPTKRLSKPECVFTRGKAPKQSLGFENEKKNKVSTKTVISEDDSLDDFFEEGNYDPEELDPEGFGDLEGFGDNPSMDDF